MAQSPYVYTKNNKNYINKYDIQKIFVRKYVSLKVVYVHFIFSLNIKRMYFMTEFLMASLITFNKCFIFRFQNDTNIVLLLKHQNILGGLQIE